MTAASLESTKAFQKIALGCVKKIKTHHRKACAGGSEAVHQMRMAITQLQAAVSFFSPMTIDSSWLRLKKEIVWLNESLSCARDSDVFIDYIKRRHWRVWASREDMQRLDDRRAYDYRNLVRSLRSVRFSRFIKALSHWIKDGAWIKRSDPQSCRMQAKLLKSHSERKLKCWYKSIVRKGQRLSTMAASRRHRLRIRIKRYRYILEALTDVSPSLDSGRFRRAQKLAARLQKTLGNLRDLERLDCFIAASGAKHRKRTVKRRPRHKKKIKELVAAAVSEFSDLKCSKIS